MNKRVFISYSWGSSEHQQWVINLGTRLMSDSVDVILDKWSLKDGQDIYSFMESMVNSNDVFRVLIICDKNYTAKANDRKGGVGTETLIITPEIYGNQLQQKFIPIVVELNDDGKASLPAYLTSRKYIDFSSEEFFESSYEELLRNILEAPAIPKPRLAQNPPSYITDPIVNTHASGFSLKNLETQIKKTPEKINIYSEDFLDKFCEELWEFRFTSRSENILIFGEALTNNLHSYKILREEFLQFLRLVSVADSNIDVELIINFFEKEPLYSRPKEEVGSWISSDFDNYKIIFHELFIYTIAICLKNKNYKLIEDLLYSKYFFKSTSSLKEEPKDFTELCFYHRNLESYIGAKFNISSGFGYFTITNLSNKVNKEDFLLADLLCHFVSELSSKNNTSKIWFPNTYPFSERKIPDFFSRISSERHFNNIKKIFNTDTPLELKEVLKKYDVSKENKERYRGDRGFRSIPFIHDWIDIEKIAIYR